MTSIVKGKYDRVYKQESTLKQFHLWGLKLGHTIEILKFGNFQQNIKMPH